MSSIAMSSRRVVVLTGSFSSSIIRIPSTMTIGVPSVRIEDGPRTRSCPPSSRLPPLIDTFTDAARACSSSDKVRAAARCTSFESTTALDAPRSLADTRTPGATLAESTSRVPWADAWARGIDAVAPTTRAMNSVRRVRRTAEGTCMDLLCEWVRRGVERQSQAVCR